MAAPPIKKKFVPFQLDEANGKYDPEIINRNFRRVTDGFGVVLQKMQTSYVALPTTAAPQVSAQSFNAYQLEVDSSGLEVVLYEFLVDFEIAPPTATSLRLNLGFLVASEFNASTVRIWVGGTFSNIGDAPSGKVIGSVSCPLGGFAKAKISESFANPGSVVPLQIAAKSAGAGHKVQLKRVAWTWST